ncbi:MAG: cysteine desulfurase [Actinomycetales bacterium]|nr:cysteine desulfurase [Actinomycetales bacterium]
MPVYLDHAATTPVFPHVAAAMAEQASRVGNASSLHTAGRAARRVVEESRERLAAAIGARPSEIVFTSGGTESDNLAISGVLRSRRDADPRRTRLVVSAIEHHAVLDCVAALESREGVQVTWLPCDGEGVVHPEVLARALATDPESVALVSVMWANNEVGTVQDVAALAAVAHAHGIPMHTDAVQAVGHLPVDVAAAGVDLLTLGGHKVGGPVGTGALVVKRDVTVVPLVYGGGQERQIRSGTLDTAGILGLSLAVEYAVETRERETARLVDLRDALLQGALELDLGIRVGGRWTPGDGQGRLAGNAHLIVPGCEGDSLLYLLDAAGIECSTGSACQAGVPQPSHVLLAMGLTERDARGALRATLGHTSTTADVEAFLAALPAAVDRARRAAWTTQGSA